MSWYELPDTADKNANNNHNNNNNRSNNNLDNRSHIVDEFTGLDDTSHWIETDSLNDYCCLGNNSKLTQMVLGKMKSSV